MTAVATTLPCSVDGCPFFLSEHTDQGTSSCPRGHLIYNLPQETAMTAPASTTKDPLLCDAEDCPGTVIGVDILPVTAPDLARLLCKCSRGHHLTRSYLTRDPGMREEADTLIRTLAGTSPTTLEETVPMPPQEPAHVIVTFPFTGPGEPEQVVAQALDVQGLTQFQVLEYFPSRKYQQPHPLVRVPAGAHDVYQRLARIYGECLELSIRKGKDYGRDTDPFANVRRIEQVGLPTWAGIFIRLGDKLARIEAAFTQQVRDGNFAMANESLEDAFRDTINYCGIALVTMEQDREKAS